MKKKTWYEEQEIKAIESLRASYPDAKTKEAWDKEVETIMNKVWPITDKMKEEDAKRVIAEEAFRVHCGEEIYKKVQEYRAARRSVPKPMPTWIKVLNIIGFIVLAYLVLGAMFGF